jgi:hypothetical protein
MNDGHLQSIDTQPEEKKLRTIEEFKTDAIAMAKRYGHPEVLKQYIKSWEESGYTPDVLGLNIQTTLEYQRNTLNKRQFRCDGSTEQLLKDLADARDGTMATYYENVLIARELVDWCNQFKALTKESQTT